MTSSYDLEIQGGTLTATLVRTGEYYAIDFTALCTATFEGRDGSPLTWTFSPDSGATNPFPAKTTFRDVTMYINKAITGTLSVGWDANHEAVVTDAQMKKTVGDKVLEPKVAINAEKELKLYAACTAGEIDIWITGRILRGGGFSK